MKSVGQLVFGLLAAVGSVMLVLSAGAISLIESGAAVLPLAELPTQVVLTQTTAPGSTPQPTIPLVWTATIAQPTICPIPSGWEPYTVQAGDTIEDLAAQAGISVELVLKGNCMLSAAALLPGYDLYLPAPTPTPTPQFTSTDLPIPTNTQIIPAPTIPACIPFRPAGWVAYTIQSGDTLLKLSRDFNISPGELIRVNCLVSSDRIFAGDRIFVPNVPTQTPTPEVTDTETPEPEPTFTETTEPAPTLTETVESQDPGTQKPYPYPQPE